MGKVPDSICSIARSLGVLGERWTFLILREAFLGATKFAEFRDRALVRGCSCFCGLQRPEGSGGLCV